MNRFKGRLDENSGVTLLKFSYNGKEFKIRTTDHESYDHLNRKYDLNVVCGDIVALGKARLYNYADKGDDIAIIDRDNDITTIITFEETQIRIRTVIDKSNVWVKKGTRIFNLK